MTNAATPRETADHAEMVRLAEAAGEEALGNLLAVIHGDGGHRSLEVGTKQAALEAEKIVANLLSSAPEACEGEAWRVERTEYAVKFWVGVQGFTVATRGDDPDGGEHLRLMEKMLRKALGRISAAPSADKLRELAEALEPFALIGAHYRTGGLRQDIESRAPSFMRMLDFKAFRRADQALAALEAEGAK